MKNEWMVSDDLAFEILDRYATHGVPQDTPHYVLHELCRIWRRMINDRNALKDAPK